MPRKWPSFSDNFCPAFTEDVEQLLARFQQTDSVRYDVFSAIWREMCFSDVFRGLHMMSEMKRFCRTTLATAVKYFLPPYSFQIRVGGLYLMHGLYHSQLAIPPVEIRIALQNWSHVERFVQDAINSGHYDVVYIYKKLVARKAIHFTAMPHFLHFRRRKMPTREAVCAEFVGRSTVIQDLFSADVLEEMANVQNLYEKMKAATPEVHSKASITHRDIVSSFKETMSEFLVWQNKTFSQKKHMERNVKKEEEEAEELPSRRAQLLSSIKQKSYTTVQGASKGRRHRPVEVVTDCKSGVEDVQAFPKFQGNSRRIRPVSLSRRTQNKLGVSQDVEPCKQWQLTIPENFPEARH